MEQDIVNNLKSRVQKLEEELLKVVSAHSGVTLISVWWNFIYLILFKTENEILF